MNRTNPNYGKAYEFFKQAIDLSKGFNRIVEHSIAELDLKRSKYSKTNLEKQRYRRLVRNRAAEVIRNSNNKSYGYHTIIKSYLEEIEELLENKEDASFENNLAGAIENTERLLTKGLQESPGDSYLISAEASLCEKVYDEEKAISALKKAFFINKRNVYLANRLAKTYIKNREIQEAIQTYSSAIEANQREKTLHFGLAKLLIEHQPEDTENILYHLRRSFTEGDSNYEAQFWHARQLYINGNTEYIEQFKKLKTVRVNPELKKDVRGFIVDPNTKEKIVFSGTVNSLEATYGWINKDRTGESVFFHITNVKEDLWDNLESGSRVKFNLGFTFHGPSAKNVKLE